jgi:hypothetical protein
MQKIESRIDLLKKEKISKSDFVTRKQFLDKVYKYLHFDDNI